VRRFFSRFLPAFLPPHRVLLCLLVAVGVANAWLHHEPGRLFSDAKNFYLPFARLLLAEGPSFLLDERTLQVGPMSYIYPALFGANVPLIKAFNMGMYGVLVLAMYRTGLLLHSRAAGLVTATLFAVSWGLPFFFASLYTEPAFISLMVVWTWLTAEVLAGGRRWLIIPAGLVMGLAILTRGTFLYFLPPVVGVGAVLWGTRRDRLREAGRDLCLIHLTAAILPIVVILKNVVLFDFRGLYTGTGEALYLGIHPLSRGLDPKWMLGLPYDGAIVLGGLPYLSVAGDAMLRGVARLMLADYGPLELARLMAEKWTTLVFYRDSEAGLPWFNPRSLRMVEIVFGVVGLAAVRPRILAVLFGGAAVYHTAVMMPLLYVPRYNSVVEIWLALLAGMGLVGVSGWLVHGGLPGRQRAGVVVAIAALAVAGGEWKRVHADTPSPDIAAVPHRVLLQVDGQGQQVQRIAARAGGGADSRPVPALRIGPPGAMEILPQPQGAALPIVASVLVAVLPPAGGHCSEAALYFQDAVGKPGRAGEPRRFRLRLDGRPHWYHAGTMNMGLTARGFFWLVLDCPLATEVRLTRFQLAASEVAETYRDRYLSRTRR